MQYITSLALTRVSFLLLTSDRHLIPHQDIGDVQR